MCQKPLEAPPFEKSGKYLKSIGMDTRQLKIIARAGRTKKSGRQPPGYSA